VALQARAQRRIEGSRDLRQELNEAGFKPEMIKANLRRLQGVIRRTEWQPDSSAWSEYAACEHVGTQRGPKEAFVRSVLGKRHRPLVWDLGANDGHFSRVAAESTDWVVAADSDHVIIDRLFRSLQQQGPANVLPMVFDIADPSPGLGWKGQERRRLEDRARPDLIMLLAVIHHLVITANLPLTEVVDWLRSLDAEIVFEWVPIDDPMARRLAVSKRPNEIHADYREEVLRQLLADRFAIAAEATFEGRTLLNLVPR
jgi:ribosomal protein L11 methylase PrmA